MDEQVANPLIVAVLFVLRCLGPVAIILGISYLLRRLGWITEAPAPPPSGNGEAAAPDSVPAAPKKGTRKAPAGRRGARR
ncbi:MAG TPA: hypothetical protein VLD63_10050 [Anaerolineales bacterium]|nr:hypothetical protein [Anaerolineales bacterium]